MNAKYSEPYFWRLTIPSGLKIAESVLAMGNGQEALYMGLIKPVMYEIGQLWEHDKISTAEEHLATSLVGRILPACMQNFPSPLSQRQGHRDFRTQRISRIGGEIAGRRAGIGRMGCFFSGSKYTRRTG